MDHQQFWLGTDTKRSDLILHTSLPLSSQNRTQI
jgi:hypothetical protein